MKKIKTVLIGAALALLAAGCSDTIYPTPEPVMRFAENTCKPGKAAGVSVLISNRHHERGPMIRVYCDSDVTYEAYIPSYGAKCNTRYLDKAAVDCVVGSITKKGIPE